MNLKKCSSCNKYTIKEFCPFDSSKTEEIAYKFPKIRDAPTNFIR